LKTKHVLIIFLFLAGALILWSQIPAAASPAAQVAYPSPTPGPDGRIIYIVQAGETCTQISLLYGVSIEYIRTTNLLDENCTLREGQKLMIGMGGPSLPTPTPGPSPTPSAVPATPTPEAGGTAKICVLVFNDANGDALRQESEGAIPGSVISLTSLDGTYSKTLTSTINPDPEAYPGMCFEDIPAGKFSVSAAVPDGYNPTINLTTGVEVIPGDVANVNFGAQVKLESVPVAPPGKGPSPLLGVIGAAILLVGIGLGVYAWSMLRKK
jgi:hypothetical protein